MIRVNDLSTKNVFEIGINGVISLANVPNLMLMIERLYKDQREVIFNINNAVYLPSSFIGFLINFKDKHQIDKPIIIFKYHESISIFGRIIKKIGWIIERQ